MQCKLCGKCGKPYSANSNYAETCKDFQSKETNENYYVDCKKILTEMESRLAQYKKELHRKFTEINEESVLHQIKTKTKINEIESLIDFINRLKAKTTDNVQEIIHCKDCHYLNKDRMICSHTKNRGVSVFYNHFCGYGAKKDKERFYELC